MTFMFAQMRGVSHINENQKKIMEEICIIIAYVTKDFPVIPYIFSLLSFDIDQDITVRKNGIMASLCQKFTKVFAHHKGVM